MAEFYPYLIASLPTLHFGMKPPFSFEQFLETCCGFIPERDYQVLSTLQQPEHYSEKDRKHRSIGQWIQLDTALRNEIVKSRAGRRHIDPATYLRPDTYTGPSLAPIVAAAELSPSVLEGEKILEQKRWNMLDEFAIGHYFDLDALIVYGYKLLILYRWEKIRSANAPILLQETVGQQEA